MGKTGRGAFLPPPPIPKRVKIPKNLIGSTFFSEADTKKHSYASEKASNTSG